MSIFQHIRETRESKKREKEFKKEIERIKKLDDEKIKEKLPEVSSEDSTVIPELVKAMTDEQEKMVKEDKKEGKKKNIILWERAVLFGDLEFLSYPLIYKRHYLVCKYYLE